MDRYLTVPTELIERMHELASAEHPREACGLLLGRVAGSRIAVVELAPTRNASDEPERRYDVEPTDQLAAELRAREAGLEVVGVWHSHPTGGAEPSETDRAAAWEEYAYVIVAGREARAWRIEGRRFHEAPIAVAD